MYPWPYLFSKISERPSPTVKNTIFLTNIASSDVRVLNPFPRKLNNLNIHHPSTGSFNVLFNMLLHELYLMTILFLWYSIVLRYPIINWILSHYNGNTVFYPIPVWYSHDIPQNSAEPMAEHGTAVFQEEANPGPGANVLWKSPRDTIGHPHSWEKSWFYHQNPSKSYTLC